MSRVHGWAEIDDMEKRDIGMVMQDRMQTIQQFRVNDDPEDDDDEFRKKATPRQHVFLRNVQGRIDRRERHYSPAASDLNKVTKHYWVATLYTRDVNENDHLRLAGLSYTVTSVNELGNNFSEAEVEITK